MYFMFTRTDSTSWGGVKKFIIPVSGGDTEYREYIVELGTNEEWKGTITQFRVDPVNLNGDVAVTADFYFDSIEFLKELPQ